MNLVREIETGNVEYKWTLVHMPKYKMEKMASQMKWRMYDNNIAWYVIGVFDDGTSSGLSYSDFVISFRKLLFCANIIKAAVCLRKINKNTDGTVWGIFMIFKPCGGTAKNGVTLDDDNIPAIPNAKIPNLFKDSLVV